MPLKLYTSPLSWNCLRPELVLAEKGITDVVRIPADLIHSTHKTAEFLEKSLFGKVPLLEVDNDDDGVAIFESRAIARYLCEKYAGAGPSLIPHFGNHESRAIWEMRLVVEATEFDVHVGPVLTEMIIRPAMGNPSDEAVLARHRPRLDKCLDGLDKALASMPYMGGGDFSLVDIVYMPGVYVAAKYVNVFVGRENLKHWWERVSVREGWKKAIEPVDETWARIVPGWKGKGKGQGLAGEGGEEEDEDKRVAHL